MSGTLNRCRNVCLMQRRNDMFTVGANKLGLVTPNVMYMYFGEAQIEEALDVFAMFIQVWRGEHAALEIFWPHQFGESREIFGRAYILLWSLDAAVGPFFLRQSYRFLVSRSPGDMQLQELGHGRWIFSCFLCAFREVFQQHFQLLRWSGRRNQSIDHSSSGFGGLWSRGSNIDRAGLFGPRIQSRAFHM